jgi:hypothetical protein
MNTYKMLCDCKAVSFLTEGQPVAKAFCHCTVCRDFYSAAVFSATAWKKEALKVTAGNDCVGHFQHPHKQLSKFFCVKCGDTLFGTNRLGMYVVPNKQMFRASDEASQTMKPDFHLFYRQRVVDIDDTLIKYLDGRSGEVFS